MSDHRRRLARLARAADDVAPPDGRRFETLMPWSDPGDSPAVIRINGRDGERFVTGEPGETCDDLIRRLGADCSFEITGGVAADIA